MKQKLLVILFSCFILSSCQQSSEVNTIIFAHSLPEKHPVHQAVLSLNESLIELSDGKMQLKIYPTGQLGSEREILELIQLGSIAMTKVSVAAMANFSPKYKVLGVPYLFQNEEDFWRVVGGPIGDEILASGEQSLLKGLSFYDAGFRSFYTKNKPIRTPEDVRGMKLRVMNDKMTIDMVNLLGGSATPMSFGELYTALQQGVVDGAENNPPSVVSSNHYEVVNYYTLDKHTYLPDVIIVGSRVWNSLTSQEQQWLQKATEQSLEVEKQLWKEAVINDMQTIRENGVEIIEPDVALFREATEPMKKKLREDSELGDLFQRLEQELNY